MKFNLLNLSVNDIFHKFIGFPCKLVILYFTIIWLHYVAFLWTSRVGYLVFTIITHSLLTLFYMMLGCSIFHRYQTLCRRTVILIVEARSRSIIKLILELLE